jgi:hypothetical protein
LAAADQESAEQLAVVGFVQILVRWDTQYGSAHLAIMIELKVITNHHFLSKTTQIKGRIIEDGEAPWTNAVSLSSAGVENTRRHAEK